MYCVDGLIWVVLFAGEEHIALLDGLVGQTMNDGVLCLSTFTRLIRWRVDESVWSSTLMVG